MGKDLALYTCVGKKQAIVFYPANINSDNAI